VEGRRKPGPKPKKGDRSQITLRVPAKHREIYALAAVANGLPLNDYLVAVLARAHHLPVPAEAPQEGAVGREGMALDRALR
jgi:predicted HicB family RNase H-like nuclease